VCRAREVWNPYSDSPHISLWMLKGVCCWVCVLCCVRVSVRLCVYVSMCRCVCVSVCVYVSLCVCALTSPMHSPQPARSIGPDSPPANVTVAILAQGTSWAVAVTQAFLGVGSSPSKDFLGLGASSGPCQSVCVYASVCVCSVTLLTHAPLPARSIGPANSPGFCKSLRHGEILAATSLSTVLAQDRFFSDSLSFTLDNQDPQSHHDDVVGCCP